MERDGEQRMMKEHIHGGGGLVIKGVIPKQNYYYSGSFNLYRIIKSHRQSFDHQLPSPNY